MKKDKENILIIFKCNEIFFYRCISKIKLVKMSLGGGRIVLSRFKVHISLKTLGHIKLDE